MNQTEDQAMIGIGVVAVRHADQIRPDFKKLGMQQFPVRLQIRQFSCFCLRHMQKANPVGAQPELPAAFELFGFADRAFSGCGEEIFNSGRAGTGD